MNWHLLPLSEITQLFNTTPKGIDQVTASERLNEHGKNQIEDTKKKYILVLFCKNFKVYINLG